MSRARFLCLDCAVDTGKANEYYMLRDEIWQQTEVGKYGMLCVGCVETRIGRQLRPTDFYDCYLNRPQTAARSQRLAQRMGLI